MGRKLGNGREVYRNALKSAGVLPADGAGASDSALGQEFLDDEPEYHEFGEFAEAS